MKKFLSAVLALAMMAAMAVPAFAAEDPIKTLPGSATQDVPAEYVPGTDNKDNVEVVYYVTVDWTVDSTLKYSDGETTYTWNAIGMQYESETENKGWSGDATVTIKVTNQSNAAVTATASWAEEGEIEADCDFTNNAAEIGSAAAGVDIVAGATGTAKDATITAKVATPTAGTIAENDATVGTITVTIAAKAD